MTISITGASDDLIEIEGDIREEFYLKDEDDGDLLAFSDGTVLRIAYTKDGIWRISPVMKGNAAYKNDQAVSADDDIYSDIVTLDGDFAWVVHGVGVATAR